MKELKIDKEFEQLIPPMQPDEFEGLRASIIKEGCRDSLVVWAETGILVDGHNRYRICNEHQIEFTTHKKKFEDRDAVLIWIIDNQCSRRNLHPLDKIPMTEKKRGILERQAMERQIMAGKMYGEGHPKQEVMDIFPEALKGNTRDILGKAIGVSGKTYSELLKVTNQGIPELVEAVRNKEVSAQNAAKIAALPPEEQKAIVKQGKSEMAKMTPHKKTSGRAKETKRVEPEKPVNTAHSDAELFVSVAISHLEQIRHDDPLKRKALDRLIQWAITYKNKRK